LFCGLFPHEADVYFLQMKAHCCQEHLRGLTCLLWHMALPFHDKTGYVHWQMKLQAFL
jgi:hypothetical protein